MNIAWALLLSLLIFLLLFVGFFLIIRTSVVGAKLVVSLAKSSPAYIAFLLAFNFFIILYTILNPWYILLTIIPVYISIVKLYEYIDDRFLDDTIGGWIQKQKIILFKVVPSQYASTSVAQMEKFLLMMHSMYGSRSQKDLRTTGKFYDQFHIEIIAKDGVTNMYIRIYESSLKTFLSAARLYFSGVKFEQIENNEIDYLPENFYEANKIWKEIDLGEFALLKSDLFPIKSAEQLSPSQEEYTQNPITQLFDYFKCVEDGDMVALQLLIMPMDVTVGDKNKDWAKELVALRNELAANSTFGTTTDGKISALTPNEIAVITNCENKIATQNFKTKIRFGYFGKKITAKRYMGGIMSYFKLFVNERQMIIPKIKTWQESENATWGAFWDNLYHKPEMLKKRVNFYTGLKDRSGDAGGSFAMWDIKSLASLIQIPTVFFETKDVIQPTLQIAQGFNIYNTLETNEDILVVNQVKKEISVDDLYKFKNMKSESLNSASKPLDQDDKSDFFQN